MHTFILIWSHRPDSQSSKVGHYIEAVIHKTQPGDTTFVYDLRNNPLPLWNERFWEKESEEYKQFYDSTRGAIEAELKKADSLVIISPERSGMAAPGIKNFILYLSPHLVWNKPSLLVSVSSTNHGGHYPIAELHMSSAKNTQLCYIPQYVVVSNVKVVLNDDELKSEDKADEYIRTRLQYSLRMLHEYSKAFQQIRASGVADFTTYANGM